MGWGRAIAVPLRRGGVGLAVSLRGVRRGYFCWADLERQRRLSISAARVGRMMHCRCARTLARRGTLSRAARSCRTLRVHHISVFGLARALGQTKSEGEMSGLTDLCRIGTPWAFSAVPWPLLPAGIGLDYWTIALVSMVYLRDKHF